MPALQTAAKASLVVDFPAPLGSGHAAASVALSNQTAGLYSALLIHDMGSELADGVPQGQAGGSQWRTTPLWGISHKIVYLHDGRTTSLDAAIDAHGGEATIVIQNYNALSPTDLANLLAFLNSLQGERRRRRCCQWSAGSYALLDETVISKMVPQPAGSVSEQLRFPPAPVVPKRFPAGSRTSPA